MNRLLFSSRVTGVAFTVAILTLTCQASDLAIQSFDGTGKLVFDAVAGATNFEVRVATTITGAWNAAGCVAPTTANMLTTTVSVAGAVGFYKVVAYTNAASPIHSGMVRIPGGTNSGTDPDYGTYSLTVEEFYMDRYEVTKSQWDEVYTWAISNGYRFDNAGTNKAPSHPVHTVNWYDVVKWCNARSQKQGLPAVYTVDGAIYKTGQSDSVVQTSAAGYRLPTDAEWEYAARGGLSGRRFPWGDTINHNYANYRANGSAYTYDTSPYTTYTYHPTYNDGTHPYTSPAGSFAANGYGLYDMSGNIWEWCFDWYPGYEGSYRVFRGGSWADYAFSCRVGHRYGNWPDFAYFSVGFRAVLPPGQ